MARHPQQGPILVVAETHDGAVTALTREVLAVAHGLTDTVSALLFAPDFSAAEDLIAHGAGTVYWCEHAAEHSSETAVAVAERLAREVEPVAVLIGHTPAGADLAPRLAFRLESAIATGCTGVDANGERILFTRPCYGGNVRETVAFGQAPAIATIRPGVGAADVNEKSGTDPDFRQFRQRGEVIRMAAPESAPRVRVIHRERVASDARALEDAKIVVAGGRGLEGPEGFRVLEGLANVLDAAVGASRVPCDLGWCPHAWQIGLTGRTVTPDLYFAVGISGAGHHLAGCGNAKTIVAINTDPDAAIFREARFGIVGDYRKVVPALIEAFKRQP